MHRRLDNILSFKFFIISSYKSSIRCYQGIYTVHRRLDNILSFNFFIISFYKSSIRCYQGIYTVHRRLDNILSFNFLIMSFCSENSTAYNERHISYRECTYVPKDQELRMRTQTHYTTPSPRKRLAPKCHKCSVPVFEVLYEVELIF